MLSLLEEKGIGWQEVLCVGDDLPDVPSCGKWESWCR
jgi:3-deoxy-D-manno-octulosonate 8-phosphate phosphatase KdsC-like HAD superfamily phosphatase